MMKELRVADVMTAQVVTLDSDDTLTHAASRLAEGGISVGGDPLASVRTTSGPI